MKIAIPHASRRIGIMLAVAVALIQTTGTVGYSDDASAYLKDLNIRQAPMARIAPPKPSGVRTDGSLAVSATLDRKSRRYKHGDDVVLTVRTTKDAYIWILDTGTSGKVHQIFPNRYEKDNFVRAGVAVRIPRADSKYRLAVSRPKGAELITVIASRENRPLTDALLDDALSNGPFKALRGTAESVAKDLSISLRKVRSEWTSDQQVLVIQ